MYTYINLYSNNKNEIYKFLRKFYSSNINLENDLCWQGKFSNPIEMVDMIGVFIDNNEKYKINMWVSLDTDVLINVTNTNADKIIRYLYERYPY